MLRIKTLNVKEYKNFKDLSVDFSNSKDLIALIGINGSGKSNFLEALSLVFKSIINKEPCGFDFELSYDIEGAEYKAQAKDGKLEPVEKTPESIIACYSGEDSRLWNSVYKDYYMSFFNDVLKDKDYLPKFLYVNKYCWKIALIALLYSDTNEKVNSFLKGLGIDREHTDISFKYNDLSKSKPVDPVNWLQAVKEKLAESDFTVEQLREVDLNNSILEDLSDSARIFYYLYFLSLPEQNEKQKVKKILSDISITSNGISFDCLSEGEKKMILIGCIAYVLNSKNSLLILDEPDVHVHVEKKEKMLEVISDFQGQKIFTTHSPIFLKNVNDNDIFYIADNKIQNSDRLRAMNEVSGGGISFIDGAYVLSKNRIVITEGPNDIKYIRQAISISPNRARYQKLLDEVAFMQAGGADNILPMYENVIEPSIDNINKVVCIFDYDDQGYINWKKIIN